MTENALLIILTTRWLTQCEVGFRIEWRLPACRSRPETILVLDPNNGEAYAYYAQVLHWKTRRARAHWALWIKPLRLHVSNEAQPQLTRITPRARPCPGNDQQLREAAKEFETAIAINGNIADLHLSLGINYRALQQYDKAVEEFNRANALNPADPMANTLISRTYARWVNTPRPSSLPSKL